MSTESRADFCRFNARVSSPKTHIAGNHGEPYLSRPHRNSLLMCTNASETSTPSVSWAVGAFVFVFDDASIHEPMRYMSVQVVHVLISLQTEKTKPPSIPLFPPYTLPSPAAHRGTPTSVASAAEPPPARPRPGSRPSCPRSRNHAHTVNAYARGPNNGATLRDYGC